MKLDLKEIITRIKAIEIAFNKSKDSTERYALIQALNHLGEVELPIHGYWENVYRKGMLKDKGAII